MLRRSTTAALLAAPIFAMASLSAMAQQPLRVGITDEIGSVTVETPNGPVEIMRDQTEGAVLDPEWALTGRECPPFCIQPNTPAEGVQTIGELELLEALQDPETIVVDSRVPDWYATGTIPGSINVPFTQAVERLGDLGCEPDFDGKFDCSSAKNVVLFCNGIWCGQSPTAIRAMIEAGFPADRISYYRGGMQTWRMLGMTVQGGGNEMPEAVQPASAEAPAETPEAAAPEAAPEAEAPASN